MPEAGLEPARLAAQVFETCASADSATPAGGRSTVGAVREAVNNRTQPLGRRGSARAQAMAAATSRDDRARSFACFENDLRVVEIGAEALH